MTRRKQDPAAWRSSAEGTRKYQQARRDAQAAANADGCDRGLEANDLFREYVAFRLPGKAHRAGHELRCEVVSCEDLARCQPGHGPC